MGIHSTFDVIFVGGGVMGCATAYYLLRDDPTLKVAIFEKDSSFRYNSTVLSEGNTRLQFNLKENVLVSQYGLEALRTFAEDMAVGDRRPEIDFRQQGNLFLTDETHKESALAGLALQHGLGCPVEWLEPEEVKSRYSLFDPAPIAGGSFGRLDGTMDPSAVLQGYKHKAVDLGATYIEAEVAEVRFSGGKTEGIRLADGETIAAGCVVNSAGAWGTDLAGTAGVELPVEPVRRQVFLIETGAHPEVVYPLTVFPTGLYLVQEKDNHFVCGKSMDDDPTGYHFEWNRNTFVEHLWPELVGFVPTFDRLRVTGGWAGLYAVNRFDGNALLGEWPELQGFYLINGFSGHGFQQCHAMGRYLAELIRGVPPSLDLSVFSPERLLRNAPIYEGHGKLV